MQAAFDGAHLHTEVVSQFLVQVAPVVQFEQRGVLRWKFIEHLPNVAPLHECLFRGWEMRREFCFCPLSALANQIDRGIDRRAFQVRDSTASDIRPRVVPYHAEKHILDDILGVAGIASDAHCHPEDEITMLGVKRLYPTFGCHVKMVAKYNTFCVQVLEQDEG